MPCTVVVPGALPVAFDVLPFAVVFPVGALAAGAGAALVAPVAVTLALPVLVVALLDAWPQADKDRPTATAMLAMDHGLGLAVGADGGVAIVVALVRCGVAALAAVTGC